MHVLFSGHWNTSGGKMNKTIKISLILIGVLLLIVGFGNIMDDSRVLTYDITAILSGIGFLILSRQKK